MTCESREDQGIHISAYLKREIRVPRSGLEPACRIMQSYIPTERIILNYPSPSAESTNYQKLKVSQK